MSEIVSLLGGTAIILATARAAFRYMSIDNARHHHQLWMRDVALANLDGIESKQQQQQQQKQSEKHKTTLEKENIEFLSKRLKQRLESLDQDAILMMNDQVRGSPYDFVEKNLEEAKKLVYELGSIEQQVSSQILEKHKNAMNQRWDAECNIRRLFTW